MTGRSHADHAEVLATATLWRRRVSTPH